MMLVFASVAALAEVSITINRDNSYADSNPDFVRKYTYLKVFDATKGTDDAISYTLAGNSPWLSVIQSAPTGYFNLAANSDNSLYYVTAGTGFTDATANTIAEWLYSHKPTSVTETEISADADLDTWTVSGLAEGYYLVIGYEKFTSDSEFTRSAKLIAATTNIDITEKNKYPTIDKKQKDTAAGEYDNADVNVKVGDTIYYQVEVDVPAEAVLPIYVTDTMTTGLTYQAGSMLIKVGDGTAAATNANVTSVGKAAGDTFDWKYEIAANENTRGKKVVFTFEALVNENAIVDTGKKNDVELQYGNTNYIIPDHVNYKIYATGALKYDGNTGAVDQDNNLTAASGKTLKPLDGAHFKLQVQAGKTGDYVDLPVAYNSTGNYYYPTSGTGVDIVTPTNGKIFIRGLDNENNYRLVETQAPEGYNLMDPTETSAMNLIADTATGDTPTLSDVTDPTLLKVPNYQGTTLPSTGGMGTTLLYVGGSILVILAAILLITKRRMSADE